MWLAKGIASEAERIRRLTIGQYLDLLKYTLEHQQSNGRSNSN
jgi:hypothetical protein